MKRPPIEYLDDITSTADQWLRRCNGLPAAGIPVSRGTLRAVLASSGNVSANDNGVITWIGDAGQFTAEPVQS